MEGLIKNDGGLLIKRGDTFKKQKCPYGHNPCGDWCPLFGEPYSEAYDGIRLDLCNSHGLKFAELVDERS